MRLKQECLRSSISTPINEMVKEEPKVELKPKIEPKVEPKEELSEFEMMRGSMKYLEARQRQTEAESAQREARLKDEIRRIEDRNRAYAAGAAAAESVRAQRNAPPDPAREPKVKSQNEEDNEAEVAIRKLHRDIYIGLD